MTSRRILLLDDAVSAKSYMLSAYMTSILINRLLHKCKSVYRIEVICFAYDLASTNAQKDHDIYAKISWS